MPSQLFNHDAVSFICGRNFTYNGKDYTVGQDFPQDEFVSNPETMVRTRYVIPVVDSLSDKPRTWHREVRERGEILERLGVAYHPAEHTVAEVKEFVEAHPEQAPEILEAEQEGKDRATLVPVLEEAADQFNPNDHNVPEVVEYLESLEDQDEYDRVIEWEKAGKARKGVLELELTDEEQ
jgi:hypothetical protein